MTDFPPLSDGRPVKAVTLNAASGDASASVTLIDYGARVQSLIVPGRDGTPRDISLGFDDMAGYEADGVSFGCTTGPVAGRIDRGRFSLEGVDYQLPPNDADGNHLHGAHLGLWVKTFDIVEHTDSSATFAYHQDAPASGQVDAYPGNVDYRVTYELKAAGESNGGFDLVITYHADTDAPTPINLTNHTYFNLGGVRGDGIDENALRTSMLNTIIRIDGSHTLAVNDRLIPTGELASVEGTPLDFRKPFAIGERVTDLHNPPKPGYDHVWALDSPAQAGTLREVGKAHEPYSGIAVACLSDQPCLVFYCGNFLDGSLVGKGGVTYGHRAGFCFEAQQHTDAINHDAFPNIVVQPGTPYRQTCVYRLTAS